MWQDQNKTTEIQSLYCQSDQNHFFKSESKQFRMQKIIEHVEIGNQREVQAILQTYPHLLVENKKIFQKALCFGDVEMAESMMNCFLQLPDGLMQMQEQFREVFPYGINKQFTLHKQNEFYFQELLFEIQEASVIEVGHALIGEDDDSGLCGALYTCNADFNRISRAETIFNPYHLLNGLKLYIEHFTALQTWEKRDLFLGEVFRFTNPFLPVCYLQAIAQGLYEVVEKNKPLKRDLGFVEGDLIASFLIDPSETHSGLGFNYAMCPAGALPWAVADSQLAVGRVGTFLQRFHGLFRMKVDRLIQLGQQIEARAQNNLNRSIAHPSRYT